LYSVQRSVKQATLRGTKTLDFGIFGFLVTRRVFSASVERMTLLRHFTIT